MKIKLLLNQCKLWDKICLTLLMFYHFSIIWHTYRNWRFLYIHWHTILNTSSQKSYYHHKMTRRNFDHSNSRHFPHPMQFPLGRNFLTYLSFPPPPYYPHRMNNPTHMHNWRASPSSLENFIKRRISRVVRSRDASARYRPGTRSNFVGWRRRCRYLRAAVVYSLVVDARRVSPITQAAIAISAREIIARFAHSESSFPKNI